MDTGNRMAALGLIVTHYARKEGEWLPMDAVGTQGGTTRMIVYREADDKYDFAGWQPWASKPFPSHGGRYGTLESAVAWLEWVGGQAA